jgi:HD-GYP domain-containing protein (c-di-GMP phosphodiesterase class II)
MEKHQLSTYDELPEPMGSEGGIWARFYRAQNLMIPVVLDENNQSYGFFALNTRELPEGGQKNLNEITGTPFKVELAGLTVYVGPVLPMMQERYIKALVALADSIDRCDHTFHSLVTAKWAQRMAERLGLPLVEVQQLELAGRLHDIGKAVVSRDMLIKSGPLSEPEWAIMHRHPAYGAALMEPSETLAPIRPFVRWHHERFDGSGYPDGIAGQEIPLGARILSVVDAFSTLTGGRTYRSPVEVQFALNELINCQETQFDPELVDLLVELVSVETKKNLDL